MRIERLLPFIFASFVALVAIGCSDDAPRNESTDTGSKIPDSGIDAEMDVVASAGCIDVRVARQCTDGTCSEVVCRLDEWCEEAACVSWDDATLSADFIMTVDDAARTVEVSVLPGGFPREFVEALSFDFGDGVSGWAESIGHEYDAPGVYPVTLVVRFTNNETVSVTKLAQVDPPDDHQPLFLTVNGIPEYTNGSRPVSVDQGTPDPSDDVEVPIHLQVVRDRFVIDVGVFDDAEDPIVRESLKLEANVDFGSIAAGEDLTDLVTFESGGVFGSLELSPERAPAEGMLTLTWSGTTESGESFEQSLEVESVSLTPETDPFDRPHVWLFRADRDYFTTQRNRLAGSQYEFVSTAEPDGEPDLIQELRLMGAQGDDEALNSQYLLIIKEAIRFQVYRYFGIAADGTPLDDIAFEIVWEDEPGAPLPSNFDEAGEFSMMRFGGFFDGYIGFSKYADFNEVRVDDSTAEYGVASAAILGTFASFPQISDAFAPIHPEIGSRLGEDPLDALVLSPDFDRYGSTDEAANARYDALHGVARYIALGLAPIVAHEMGHAMGLMPNGLPPEGYYGGRGDVSFIGEGRTNRHHADLPGVNLMQAGGDSLGLIGSLSTYAEIPNGAGLIRVAEVLALETKLSPLSRAYLQRRLTHTP